MTPPHGEEGMSAATPAQSRRSGQRLLTPARVPALLLVALIWLGGLVCIFPLVWTVIASFRPDSSFLINPLGFSFSELTADNYKAAFNQADFGTGFKNTTVEVLVILATTLFFCPLAGYGFAKFAFRGKRFLFGLMMLTLFFVPLT